MMVHVANKNTVKYKLFDFLACLLMLLWFKDV